MQRRALLATALFGGLASLPALAQQKTIVLYSPNPEQAIDIVSKTIAAKTPGTKANSITGGSAVLLRRLEAEAKDPQGNLFWNSSMDVLDAFLQAFQAYDSPELSAIPQELRYPGNVFTPTNVHVVTIMVNTDQLGTLPPPKTWSESPLAELEGQDRRRRSDEQLHRLHDPVGHW